LSAAAAMLHQPKRFTIHLVNSGNESVGSDVEKNFQWDCSLCSVKTFQTAVLILSGYKFESPNLKLLQKILLMFIADHSCNYYFKRRSPQATAFGNIQAACKVGWNTEASHKKKWTVRVVAECLKVFLQYLEILNPFLCFRKFYNFKLSS
jgi:hypothetical protein